MVEWFVNLHNNINIKKNEKSGPGTFRTDWTAQEVITKYTNTNYTNLYGIDMGTLSTTNTLSTFYTKLKTIQTTINSDKIEYTNFTLTTATSGLTGSIGST